MVSWVVLTGARQTFSIDQLRQKLDAAFPGAFLPPDDMKSFVVKGPMPGQFLIQSRVEGASGLFLLHHVPAPYTQFSDAVRRIADPALQRVARAQCCWLSMDRMGTSDNDEEAYRFIGGALARLAPDHAAVLLHPTDIVAMPFDTSNRQRLAAGLRPSGL